MLIHVLTGSHPTKFVEKKMKFLFMNNNSNKFITTVHRCKQNVIIPSRDEENSGCLDT